MGPDAEHTPEKHNTAPNIKHSLPLHPLYKQSSILTFCNKRFSTPPSRVIAPSIPPIIKKKIVKPQEPLHVFTGIQPTSLQFSPVRASVRNTTTLQRSPTSSSYTPHSIRTQTKITNFFRKKNTTNHLLKHPYIQQLDIYHPSPLLNTAHLLNATPYVKNFLPTILLPQLLRDRLDCPFNYHNMTFLTVGAIPSLS
jgi:hypothetical protein